MKSWKLIIRVTWKRLMSLGKVSREFEDDSFSE